MKTESVETLSNYIDLLLSLNDVEDRLSTARDRQSEVELRISDILHFLEELPLYTDNELTPNQCQLLVHMLQEFRQVRRSYKKEQYLNDTLESHRAKIAYGTQRQMLITELKKREKELDTLYKPRKLTYEEIWDMITPHIRGKKLKNPFKIED